MSAEPHAHELDGKLHEDCAMCDMIRARQVGASKEAAATAALAAHQKRAERSKIGAEELRKASEGGSTARKDEP